MIQMISLEEKIIGNLQESEFQYIIDLERKIFGNILCLEDKKLLIDVEDRGIARRVFYSYTLPLLEGAGLCSPKQQKNAIFWGTIHLCLGLHLRYADYIIDNDKIDKSPLSISEKSYLYLLLAQMLLSQKGYLWGEEQLAMYRQYFDYENEINCDQFHDFGSLWRRVSPLLVICESYLKSSWQIIDLNFYYKRYLSCFLLKEDCIDIIKDINFQKTPVTSLISDYGVHIDGNLVLMVSVIDSVNVIVNRTLAKIKNHISEKLPIWKIIIDSFLS